jgi:hypothetical protein
MQAGRMYPAVPRAQDLPSAIAALNQLTQILLELASPGLPAFQNNLATFTLQPAKAGTNGITAAYKGGGSFAMDGDDGNKAETPNWRATRVNVERIKVKSKDDEDEYVTVQRIVSLEFTDQTNPDSTITFSFGEV